MDGMVRSPISKDSTCLFTRFHDDGAERSRTPFSPPFLFGSLSSSLFNVKARHFKERDGPRKGGTVRKIVSVKPGDELDEYYPFADFGVSEFQADEHDVHVHGSSI